MTSVLFIFLSWRSSSSTTDCRQQPALSKATFNPTWTQSLAEIPLSSRLRCGRSRATPQGENGGTARRRTVVCYDGIGHLGAWRSAHFARDSFDFPLAIKCCLTHSGVLLLITHSYQISTLYIKYAPYARITTPGHLSSWEISQPDEQRVVLWFPFCPRMRAPP